MRFAMRLVCFFSRFSLLFLFSFPPAGLMGEVLGLWDPGVRVCYPSDRGIGLGLYRWTWLEMKW
jgi:hypothetical protein